MNIALLHKLRRAGGAAVPMEDLGADPLAVRADLDELEAFGFGIERHPYRGVAYLHPPDRLCPDQIEWELGTRLIGRRVAVWNRVTSTNDLAARAAASEANAGLAILAEGQTAGRGSRGRTWVAPPGSSILMSVLLFPPPPLQDPAWLTALAAVALAGAIDLGDCGPGAMPGEARIKWPNDILIDGRKVAGILVERGLGTVLGIGLNVNLDLDQFPPDLRDSATSLRRVFGRPLDRSEVARNILRELDRCYDRAATLGPDWLNAAYGRRSEHLGHDVEVTTPAGIVAGRLGSIDLRSGLAVGRSRDDCRRVPIEDVAAISHRPGSMRWTPEEIRAGWPPPPGVPRVPAPGH